MKKTSPRGGRRIAPLRRTAQPPWVEPPSRPGEERDALFGRLTGQMIRLRRQQQRRRMQKRLAVLLLLLAVLGGLWKLSVPQNQSPWQWLRSQIHLPIGPARPPDPINVPADDATDHLDPTAEAWDPRQSAFDEDRPQPLDDAARFVPSFDQPGQPPAAIRRMTSGRIIDAAARGRKQPDSNASSS